MPGMKSLSGAVLHEMFGDNRVKLDDAQLVTSNMFVRVVKCRLDLIAKNNHK